MRNLGNDTEFMWCDSTFVNRKFAMEDMYHNYQNGDDDWDLPKVKLVAVQGKTNSCPR